MTSTPVCEPFGTHVMIDAYDATGPLMTDRDLLRSLLTDLPARMGMHPICDPVVVAVGANCKKDPGGLSGFVMIAESHISFHTFPARHFVTIDLYTCQVGIDAEAIVHSLTSAFGVRDAEVTVVPRGLRYPPVDLDALKKRTGLA